MTRATIPPFGPPSSGLQVGRLGYGLMNLTWKPTVTPDGRAFAAILTALEGGATFLNAGEFYSYATRDDPDRLYGNLALLKRFFDKYPEWAEPGKCFLSVKGGIRFVNGHFDRPDGSPEFLHQSVVNINTRLGGRKKMDLFEMARVDPTRSIEEVMNTLKGLVNEGHMKHIGLSEVSEKTIRKAHAVHPVSAVEVEYSMWALDIEQNGVLETCQELGIPVIAYSPLGRGMLTGTIQSLDDIPEDDGRRQFDRFKPENFDHNLKLVRQIQSLAAAKGVTPTQLALAWLIATPGVLPIPGSTRIEGVNECLEAAQVHLSDEEKQEIRKIVDAGDVKGGRYYAMAETLLAV